MSGRRRRGLPLLLAAAVALSVAACGGEAGEPVAEPSHQSGATAPQGGVGGAASGTASPDARTVRVGLTEWTIAVGRETLPPGRITFVVTNTGATEHDLVVHGRRGTWRTDDLDPGERARLTVRAEPGERLHLWCSEPGHEVQGMHTRVPVRR